MSPLEWLGESHNPGAVGTIDVGVRRRRERPRIGVLVCFVLAVLLLVLWIYVVLGVWQIRSAAGLAGIVLGTVCYLLVAYAVRPAPDASNIGWMGGLFDHPFQYSDDINRFLNFYTLLLLPGRFVSESLVEMRRFAIRASHPGSIGEETGGRELNGEPGVSGIRRRNYH
jgi:hypothetical protein